MTRFRNPSYCSNAQRATFLRRVRIVAVGGSVLLYHCTSFKPGLGFQEVKDLVAKRTDKEIRWTTEVTADSVSADVEGAVVRKRLTLDVAIQQALFRSPALQAIYETLGVAQADMLVSRWPRNPILDAEARVGSGTPDVEFSLLQNLLDIFYIPLRRRLSAAEFEAAKFKVASSVQELIARVRVPYYNLQAAIARREFMQIVAAARDASFDLARRLHEAGNLTDLEFANEEALYRLAEIKLKPKRHGPPSDSSSRLSLQDCGDRRGANS